jgi:hydroxymethylbilane synthase
VLRQLNDPATFAAVKAERALLAHLRGGCMAPVGALARAEDGRLRLQAAVLSTDGTKRVEAAGEISVDQAKLLGEQVAEWLLEQGAAELIATARSK